MNIHGKGEFAYKKTIILYLTAGLLVVSFWGALKGNCAADESGKTIYDKKCAICHGADDRGDTPVSAAYSPSPTDFNSASFWQRTSDTKIRETVEKGLGSMPPLIISSGETNAVINYMKQAYKPLPRNILKSSVSPFQQENMNKAGWSETMDHPDKTLYILTWIVF